MEKELEDIVKPRNVLCLFAFSSVLSSKTEEKTANYIGRDREKNFPQTGRTSTAKTHIKHAVVSGGVL